MADLTERVVLERREVEIDGKLTTVWLELGVAAGTKREAVEATVGAPGGETARAGTWRAPSLRSWREAISYEEPEKKLVRRVAD